MLAGMVTDRSTAVTGNAPRRQGRPDFLCGKASALLKRLLLAVAV